MPKSHKSTGEKERVKIIIVGAPRAIQSIITLFHILTFLKVNEWLEVKQSENPDEVMMAATKTLQF